MFRDELQRGGKTATGITVPAEVLDALGGGRRPAVAVTIHGHLYRTTVGVMGGVAMIPVSAAVRDAAGVTAGDVLDVEIVADTAPRTVDVPADLAAAMAARPEAAEFFGPLSYSRRKAWVTWVEQARQAETRSRRVEQTVAMLADHRPQR
ncbi:MAG: YdeI/OmpD-associated family protein [Streptosporangiaceae bacterium]